MSELVKIFWAVFEHATDSEVVEFYRLVLLDADEQCEAAALNFVRASSLHTRVRRSYRATRAQLDVVLRENNALRKELAQANSFVRTMEAERNE